MHNYILNTQTLVNEVGIDKSDIFFFDDSPFSDIFEKHYQFCQENLLNYCTEYNIQPSFIYYRDNLSVNARAGKIGNTYVIGINKATIFELYRLFHPKSDDFWKNPMVTNYTSLNSFFDVNIGFLMFQISGHFTYYHELTHLIQKSNYLNGYLNESYESGNFDYLKHILEFDADLHATHWVAFHAMSYWRKQETKYKTLDNFIKFASINLASIYSYFMLFFSSVDEKIYYYEKTHPHALIRMTYIIPMFLDVLLRENRQINPKDIILNAFQIANSFFEQIGKGSLNGFYENKLFTELQPVQEYIGKLIIDADKIEWLVINSIHKKKLYSK